MSDTDTPDPDSIDFDDDGVTVQTVLRHRNKDETAVLVTNFGDGYQAIALDVDAGGQVLDTDPDPAPVRGQSAGIVPTVLRRTIAFSPEKALPAVSDAFGTRYFVSTARGHVLRPEREAPSGVIEPAPGTGPDAGSVHYSTGCQPCAT
jgi:hypothetical protein